jgi:hypothetical protein
MQDIYYIVMETKEDYISLFNLYDDKNKKLFDGEDKIKDSFIEIKSDSQLYFNLDHLILVPINQYQFNLMLDFSIKKLSKMNYKKFIKDYNLIEWII